MTDAKRPDLRLAPDAQITWSIPKQEWDAFVREQRKFVGPSVGAIVLVFGWMLMLIGFVGVPLWMLITTNGSRGFGDGFGDVNGAGWLILGATALLFSLITSGLWTSAGRGFLRMIAFRRRGTLVWEQQGCVCPTCLKPFGVDGRATCRHRFAACQQPTILRMLEAEATEDEPRETELKRLLDLDARQLEIASTGRGPMQLLRRLDAREPDAFPKPARIAYRCINYAVLIGLFWIAAGWAMIAWVPALSLLAIASQFGQRARRHVYGRVICTKCSHLIDDLRRTSVCSECGADLTKVGGVRSAKLEFQWNFALAGWACAAAALLWGFYLAALSVRVLPTGVLIAAINGSVGSISAFSDELARRKLTTEESIAAADATLRWNARNPFGSTSTKMLPYVIEPQSLASLTESTLDVLTDVSIHPDWIVGERPATRLVANGGRATIREGANAHADILFELAPRLPALALIVIRTTNVAVVRSTDQTSVTIDSVINEHRYDGFRIQADKTVPEISTAQLSAGRYDITVTYTVRFLPPMTGGWTNSPSILAQINEALENYPATTRTATLTLDVE